MIASAVQHLEAIFGWILAASWQASVLAVLVLLLQATLGARLNPRWRYALWLLVLVRLVLPALPESALSLFQFAPTPPAQLVNPVTEPWQPLFTGKPYPSPQDPSPTVIPNYPVSYFTLLAFIWLMGAVVLFILTWQVNRRFARQVANSPEISDPELVNLFATAKVELGIRRPIRLIENSQVQSPAIMGLFRPTLLLPAHAREKFDRRELRFIFLHELAHLKRGDVIAQALIALLQIVHWFNPVLWFAFRRMRIDREPATDALVLSRTGEAEKESYGLMLIKLLEHFNQRHSLPTLVGILEDKDQFKRRFSLIARFTRGAYGWSLLGVLLIGVLAIVCLTKAKATQVDADSQMLQAIQKGDATTLHKLLDQGLDPNEAQSNPVYWAVFYHQPEILKALLDHGAFPYWTGPKNEDALLLARRIHPDLVSILQEGSDRNRPARIARLTAKLEAIHIDLPAFSSASLKQVTPTVMDEAKKSESFGSGFLIAVLSTPETASARITLPPQTNVSISDALKAITDAAKLQFHVNDLYDVRISPLNWGEGALVVKTLAVPVGFFKETSGSKVNVKQELAERGITIHTNAQEIYVPEKKSLVVYDTPEQVEKIAALLTAESPRAPTIDKKTGSASSTNQNETGKMPAPFSDVDVTKIPAGLSSTFGATPKILGPALVSGPPQITGGTYTNSKTVDDAAAPSADMVRIVTKVIQIGEDDYQAHQGEIDDAVGKGDVAALNGLNLKSFHLVSDPFVLVKAGEQGVVEVVRLLHFASAYGKDSSGKQIETDFKTVNLGTRFVFKPIVTGGKIDVHGNIELLSLARWTPAKDVPPQPDIHHRNMAMAISLQSGHSLGIPLLGGAQMESRDPTFIFTADQPPSPSQNPQILARDFLILSAELYTQDGKPVVSATSTTGGAGSSPPNPNANQLAPAPANAPTAGLQIKVSIAITGKNVKDWTNFTYGKNWTVDVPNIAEIDLNSTVRSGEVGTAESVRSFAYPSQFEAPKQSSNLVVPMTPREFKEESVGWTMNLTPILEGGLVRLQATATYTVPDMKKGVGVYGENSGPIYADIKDAKTGAADHVLLSPNTGVIPSFQKSVTPFFIFAQPGKPYKVKLQAGADSVDATVTCVLL